MIHEPLFYRNREPLGFFRKVAIFDRDGTLNVDSGYTFDTNFLNLIDGVVETLQYLKTQEIEFVIVTNQSGISRGIFTQEQMELFNSQLSVSFELLSKFTYSYLVACPHSPMQMCPCRKPSGYMLSHVKRLYGDVDYCYFGDKLSDTEAAVAADMDAFLVNQGELLQCVQKWDTDVNS